MFSEETTYREGVMRRFDDLDRSLFKIDEKISFTNGKVRKIIVAVVFLAGLTVGLGIVSMREIAPLLGI